MEIDINNHAKKTCYILHISTLRLRVTQIFITYTSHNLLRVGYFQGVSHRIGPDLVILV